MNDVRTHEQTAAAAMPARTMLVAIDGPAGSGKSSVAREVAVRRGFGILDTGAAYRALAWAAIKLGRDLDSAADMVELLNEWRYCATLQGEAQFVVELPATGVASAAVVDEATGDTGVHVTHEVTVAIRQPEISAEVSRVSRHTGVREQLNRMFHQMVAESGLPGVVIEGRDITTVVAPDAPVRILMTASPEVRAERRTGELAGADRERVLADILARDAKDALVVDFQRAAPGVTLIDTSECDFEQAVQAVIDVVQGAEAAAMKEGK